MGQNITNIPASSLSFSPPYSQISPGAIAGVGSQQNLAARGCPGREPAHGLKLGSTSGSFPYSTALSGSFTADFENARVGSWLSHYKPLANHP